MVCQWWQHGPVTKETRATSKARTRQRVLDEAQRLFREHGYAATSLEQIAEAAQVTKGAIYGHFSSKEELLLSAIEATPTRDYGTVLNDASRPLRERLAEFAASVAADEATTDKAEWAVSLEFIAALLRSPAALDRYVAGLWRRLEEATAGDTEPPLPGITQVQAWAIGYAMSIGLQLYRCIAPDLITPEAFERAYVLIVGLYPEPSDPQPSA